METTNKKDLHHIAEMSAKPRHRANRKNSNSEERNPPTPRFRKSNPTLASPISAFSSKSNRLTQIGQKPFTLQFCRQHKTPELTERRMTSLPRKKRDIWINPLTGEAETSSDELQRWQLQRWQISPHMVL